MRKTSRLALAIALLFTLCAATGAFAQSITPHSAKDRASVALSSSLSVVDWPIATSTPRDKAPVEEYLTPALRTAAPTRRPPQMAAPGPEKPAPAHTPMPTARPSRAPILFAGDTLVSEPPLPGPSLENGSAAAREMAQDADAAAAAQGEALAVEDNLSAVCVANPTTMVAPGAVDVAVTIENIGAGRIDDIRVLDAAGQMLDEIGSLFPEGQMSYTSNQTINITSAQLENNGIPLTVTYTLYTADGRAVPMRKDVFASVIRQPAEPRLEFTRTLSGDHVQKGDSVTITYRLRNTGNVALTNLSLEDALCGVIGTLESLEPGKKETFTAKVVINQTSVSRPTVRYRYEGAESESTDKLKASTVYLADERLDLYLDADKVAVSPGEVVTLRLKLVNNGNVSYENLRISDPSMGELGMITSELKPGQECSFSKTINLKTTTTFAFDVSGKSVSGSELETSSNMLTVVVSPQVRNIDVSLSASVESPRLSQPGPVAFTIQIDNHCDLDIRNASLSEQTRGPIKNLAVLAPGPTVVEQTFEVEATGTYIFLVELSDTEGGRLTVLSNPVTVEINRLSMDASPPPAEETLEPEALLRGESYKLDDTSTFQRMMLGVLLLLSAFVLFVLISSTRKRRRNRRAQQEKRKQQRQAARSREKSARVAMAQTKPHPTLRVSEDTLTRKQRRDAQKRGAK